MTTSINGTITSKKWLLVVLIHAFGYTLIYLFSLGPLAFPYDKDRLLLQNILYFLACYMLAQYVLLQILVGGKWCGRRCHFRMCMLDAGISAIFVVLILIMPAVESWIKHFCLIYHVIGLGPVLLSTIITLFRTRHLSAPTKQDCTANNTQHDARNAFDFVNLEDTNRDSAE